MTRITTILPRLGKYLAWRAPALLLLAAPAGADDAIPCNRIAKVVATGTIADRNELARSVNAEPREIAAACPVELMRAYRDPLRAKLPRPSPAAWIKENQWLAALMQQLVPAASAEWAPLLDSRVIPVDQMTALAVYWTGVTGTAATVFATLGQLENTALRNEVLHQASAWLVRLEAADVTSATRSAAALEKLGFGFLNADAELASLWALRGPGAPAAVTDAEFRLAKGDLAGAFTAYLAAARADKRYRLQAGILADRLMRAARRDTAPLIAAGIAYGRCEDGYKVQWEYGALSALLNEPDPEVRAEARLRAREACREVPELPDEVDEVDEQYATLLKGFEGTRAAHQRRLVYLERVRAEADELGTHGRLVLANELRAWLWKKSEPRSFAVLGGPTQARRLRDQIRGYLAFPPEPEVHVNEKD